MADDPKPKKERVLHTRVPEVMETELKRLAGAWRVPVSNLVRAILEDALDTVDVVASKAEGELRGVAEKLSSERHRMRERSIESLRRIEAIDTQVADASAPAASQSEPLGYSRIVLTNDAVCARTGRKLPAGSEALLLFFREPGRQELVAPEALPQEKA